MLTTKLAVIAVAIAWMTIIPAQATPLLVNGSFETGPDPGFFTNFAAGSTDITGWTVALGNIDYIGALWVAANGSRSLDLEGSVCDLATPNCPGGISQSFATVTGQKYLVTFDLAGNPFSGPITKTVHVSAAGQSQDFSFNTAGRGAGNMGWVADTWTFTAFGPQTTLEFDTADSPPTGWGPALDNVSVSPVASAVPEPSSLLLLGAGLTALAGYMRNGKRIFRSKN